MIAPTPHTEDLILAARGVDDMANIYGWRRYAHFGKQGWAYPLRCDKGLPINLRLEYNAATVERWKNLDSDSNPKYLYLTKDVKHKIDPTTRVDFYFVQDIHPHIKARDGKLVLACGEMDMLSFLAAGIHNVTSLFGEKNIPDDIVPYLLRLGVSRVTYYPDNDTPGKEAAQKLHDIFANSMIRFTAYQLPNDIDDINALWIKVKFDRVAFIETLSGLEKMTFRELPPPEIATGAIQESPLAHDDVFEPGLYQAIEAALGVKGRWDADGWSENVPCPFHDDKTPSAGWNKESHVLKCFVCGEKKFLAKEVADQLGIDWHAYVIRSPNGIDKAGLGAQPAIPLLPAPQIEVVSSDDLLKRFEQRFSGQIVSDYPPVINPWSIMHHIGGMCQVWLPGKAIGVLGLSGGGKTSYFGCTSDKLNQVGVDTIWWGSEWTPDQMTDRRIQRLGGVTINQMAMLELHHHEQKHNITMRYGQPVTSAELIAKTKDAVATIAGWPGKTFYADKSDNLDSILLAMAEAIEAKKQQQRLIRVAFFDYVQLLQVVGAGGEYEAIHLGVNKIKAFLGAYGLIGLIGSQPRKVDASAAKVKAGQERQLLTNEAALAMRDHKFNLFLTLNLNPPVPGVSQYPTSGVIVIGKNSSEKSDSKIGIKVNLPRLSWLDERANVEVN